MFNIYVLVATIVFGTLAIMFSDKTWKDMTFKVISFIMAMWGSILLVLLNPTIHLGVGGR